MSLRKPIVIADGQTEQLQAADGLDLGNKAPGIDTPATLFSGSVSTADFNLWAGGIYDASSVDLYLIIGGQVVGGTRSSPEFSATYGASYWKRLSGGTFELGVISGTPKAMIPNIMIGSVYTTAKLPFALQDGTYTQPSLMFASDTDTGFYRHSDGTIGIVSNATSVAFFSTTGIFFNRPFVLPAGSEAAPSISFGTDPDTGFYHPAEDTLAVTTGGIKKLQISDSIINSYVPWAFPAGTAADPSIQIIPGSGFYSPAIGEIALAIGGNDQLRFNGGVVESTVPIFAPGGSAVAPSITSSIDTDTGIFWVKDSLHFTVGGVDKFSIGLDGVYYTVPFLLPDGTAAAPAYTFTTDPDTGMYRAGDDRLGFSTGGVAQVQIAPNGQVLVRDGSATAPSVSFTSDTDTGMYRYSNNILGFSAQGMCFMASDGYSVYSFKPVFNIAGTAAAPAYTFTSSHDTGFYLKAAGQIGVSAAGSEKVVIDSTGISVTPDPPANSSGWDNVVTRKYVESRGMNLVSNGTGFMKSNYNFAAYTFDSTLTHGGFGSFLRSTTGTVTSDEVIAVDPTRKYQLSLWAMSGNADGTHYDATNRQYFGIIEYDADGNYIIGANIYKCAGSTDTTLAQALNPGDTKIYLTTVAGWCNDATAYGRHLAWYPYTNVQGYTYPDYTYTRNHTAATSDGAWAAGAVNSTENSITLRTAWTGPALAAGTKVRNAIGGTSYKYIAGSNVITPNAWTRYSGIVGGLMPNSYDDSVYTFRYGTAFVKVLHLPNYGGASIDNYIRISDVWFGEIDAEPLLEDGTAADPSLSFYKDTDTGIFRYGTDWLGITTGGVMRFNVSSTVATSLVKLLEIDGTAAAPSYTFASDLDTGIFRSAENVIGIAAGGVSRFTVSANYVTAQRPLACTGGTLAAPGVVSSSDVDTGIWWPAANTMGFVAGGVEAFRFTNSEITFNLPTNIGAGITTAVTYYLSPSGNDTTGSGTDAAPWLTIGKALSSIENKTIGETGSVTIILKDGLYAYTSQVFINHASKGRITIRGQNTYTKTVSSIISAARWADTHGYNAVIQLNDVTNIAVNDFVIMGVNDSLTGTFARLMSGCHKVIAVDTANKRITVAVYIRMNAFPSASTLTGDVTVIKSILQFTNCNGFLMNNPGTIGLSKMVLVGVGGNNTGVQSHGFQASFSLDAPFGISGAWYCGLSVNWGATINMLNTAISGPYIGMYIGRASCAGASGCVVNGCGSDNVQGCDNASIDFNRGISFGSGGFGANIWNEVVLSANSSAFMWNIATGCHPGWNSFAELNYAQLKYNGDGGVWLFNASSNLYASVITDNTNYGIKAESTSAVWGDAGTNVNNGYGYTAYNNSSISRIGATVSNTVDYSPALGVVGNNESIIF